MPEAITEVSYDFGTYDPRVLQYFVSHEAGLTRLVLGLTFGHQFSVEEAYRIVGRYVAHVLAIQDPVVEFR